MRQDYADIFRVYLDIDDERKEHNLVIDAIKNVDSNRRLYLYIYIKFLFVNIIITNSDAGDLQVGYWLSDNQTKLRCLFKKISNYLKKPHRITIWL